MITPPADDLAARGTVLFCQRLQAAKDDRPKPGILRITSDRTRAVVFRADGSVEHHITGR